MGTPTTYLFASRACHQTSRYILCKSDRMNIGTDAMQHPWEMFAFPPFSLISLILRKDQKVDHLILVTPPWQT